jgi:hypothetical protein
MHTLTSIATALAALAGLATALINLAAARRQQPRRRLEGRRKRRRFCSSTTGQS